MSDLLLITDIPRLGKIFTGLNDIKGTSLRIASSLEQGAAELAAAKPDIVFVQPHLSGLSAEIILMHLKKQLGRKRSRFVLLASADQAGDDTLRLYQGNIDPSAEDEVLFACIQETIAALLAKPSRKSVAPQGGEEGTTVPAPNVAAPQSPPPAPAVVETPPVPAPVQLAADEPSLEDQGITYGPRNRLQVYSEFTSSFESAVETIKPAPINEVHPEPHHTWSDDNIETVSTPEKRSTGTAFLLWLAPVVIAVVVFTYLQQKRVTPNAPDPAKPAPVKEVSAPPAKAPQTLAPPQAPPATAAPQAVATADQGLSDKAVLSAIAESRPKKSPVTSPAPGGRPTALPDFIPTYGLDKTYAQANPGWERYKGQVTEFKVFREGGGIKAIQAIDRGGNGVPESFMKAAIRQVSSKSALAMEGSERKEGYEIQRGQTGDGIKVMLYRDEQGGKLRAFVLTWQ